MDGTLKLHGPMKFHQKMTGIFKILQIILLEIS